MKRMLHPAPLARPGKKKSAKSLTEDNLRISRSMSEIASFNDINLATLAKIWVFYFEMNTPQLAAAGMVRKPT